MNEKKCNKASLKQALDGFPGEVRWQEAIAPYTSLKVGGPAEAMVFPASVEEVVFLMQRISRGAIPYFVLGNGSNLIVRSGGFNGIVLHLKHLNRIALIGIDDLLAEGGASFPKLAAFAMEHHLSGLEFAAGIPGTVGGAVAMNAGIPGQETGAWLVNIALIDEDGVLREINPRTIAFSYRKTTLPRGVIVSAAFRLTPRPAEEIEKDLKSLMKNRRERQPLNYPNCGSVFKNPAEGFAGEWLEKAGLKGLRIGDAQISEKHGNFIVNHGSATAEEVLALIEKMQETVKARFGIALELEVKIIGSE